MSSSSSSPQRQFNSIQDDNIIDLTSSTSDPLDSIKTYDYEEKNKNKRWVNHIMKALEKIVQRVTDLFNNDELCYFFPELRLIGYTHIINRYADSKGEMNLSNDFFLAMKNNIHQYMINDINIIQRVIPKDVFPDAERQQWRHNCQFILILLSSPPLS